jgi:hypothetical protein
VNTTGTQEKTMMRTRDVTRQAASDGGLPLVSSDERRDQFDRDGALLTVDYTANGAILKAWVNERMGERATVPSLAFTVTYLTWIRRWGTRLFRITQTASELVG